MEREYWNEYRISRIILTVCAAIGAFIAFINEHISVKMMGMILITGIVFLVSFFGTGISKRIMRTGDKIRNIFLRILYYSGLFVAIVGIAFGGYLIITAGASGGSSNDLADALGKAIFLVFVSVALTVVLFVPYAQTLVVLLLRVILKSSGSDS